MDLSWAASQLAARTANHTLPQGLYLDQRSHDFDMHAIYGQSWLMAAMECELPANGSYLAMNVGPWPVVLVRDRDGEIRAFHNSCRHRGSMLCQTGSGTAPKLVCPYHRWTYDLDGSLFAAARMGPDFDKSEHGLKPVALRCVAGALFICLAETPPHFDNFAKRFAAAAAPLNFANMKVAATDLMVAEANWKLVMENARECYHCPSGHPELGVSFPVTIKGHFDFKDNDRMAAFDASMAAAGLAAPTETGLWWQLSRFPLNEGAVTISMDGAPVCQRPMVTANGGDVGSFRWALDPHFFGHATSDQVFVFSCTPASAEVSHALSKWYVHKDAVEGVDYHLPELKQLWITTNLQDKALAENNQLGVRSPGYTPGPYSPEGEQLAQQFTDWYCATAQAYIDRHG